MPTNPLHVVDVFAQEKYAGNQLAVVHDAATLSDEEMQKITRETNFSEATFIESADENGGYEVRIFDPAEEIPFAGHPTLGTAFVIREFVRDDHPDELTLNLGVGQIPIHVETDENGNELFWMRQIPPAFEKAFDRGLAARVLSLNEDDIDEAYPVQLVSTGLPTLVVPLRSLDAVKRAQTNHKPYYEELIEPHGNLNVLLFAPETEDGNDLHARVFADCAGVPEDPATGSSNGCLAAYLVEHDYFDSDEIDVRVEQGYEMDRPSLLHLRAAKGGDKNGIEVQVGGRVIPVAEGNLL
ncbi:trans-2,3-dihydro-3-hydroxyanthranilate isomerase [Haladaptatus litoreus]|uniref:Trans-2,3-dihydro-3-hydroxyanthranilate isomerase n=1 Tax=Haladaptatus litoreus TaxID=553468 RepID=A0A1N6ZDM6_9EURY|nr:PhzF family phenazine biosynthesis protein [Haladaptatus litoreus]SIR24899.1 trans-2,3-dihydro-3-hydroxyanthranilate isomerase [Haladaptatus litoreus]